MIKVARVAANRTVVRAGRPERALIVALSLLCMLAGCGREPVERPVRRPAEFVDGHAWTARLVSRHPLWSALASLESALDELSEDEWEPTLAPIDRRFVDVAFIGSFALADPRPRIAALQDDWRADYPPLMLPGNGLSPDLQTRVDWERERADRAIQDRMAQAQSRESRRLARMRAELVAYYQERLTNLSIDATIRDDEAGAAAEAELQRVWAIIETEMDAARSDGEQRLADLRAQLGEDAQARVERARERARAIGAERDTAMREAGAEVYDRMIAQMQRPWRMPEAGEVSTSITAEAANASLDAIGLSRAAAEAARDEKMSQQREQMAEAVGRLRAQIKTGTETAAEVVAYRNGIRLQVLPGGTRRGSDVTALIAEELDDFWAVRGG